MKAEIKNAINLLHDTLAIVDDPKQIARVEAGVKAAVTILRPVFPKAVGPDVPPIDQPSTGGNNDQTL